MVNKYIKYLPWVILGAFSSYLSATYYARNSFDLFYLTLIFLIADIAILVFYENKPTGGKPGFVTYTGQKTLRVTPEEEKIKAMKLKD